MILKKVIAVGMIMALLIVFTTLVNLVSAQISLDQQRYTESSYRECKENKCTITNYPSQRFVREQGIWKKIEDANRLDDKGVFDILITENDTINGIDIIKYNFSCIEMKLFPQDEKLFEFDKAIPIKIDDSIIGNLITLSSSKEGSIVTICKETIINKEISYGAKSTSIIITADSNTGFVSDTDCSGSGTEFENATDQEYTLIGTYTTGSGKEYQTLFDFEETSDIPDNATIDAAWISYYLNSNGIVENVYSYGCDYGTLDAGDFDTANTTEEIVFGTSSTPTAQWNDANVSLDAINKTGNTQICTYYDDSCADSNELLNMEYSSGYYANLTVLYTEEEEGECEGYEDWANTSFPYRTCYSMNLSDGNLSSGYEIEFHIDSSNIGSNFNWSSEVNDGGNMSRPIWGDLFGNTINSTVLWANSTSEEGVWTIDIERENNYSVNDTVCIYYGNSTFEHYEAWDDVYEKFVDTFEDNDYTGWDAPSWGGGDGCYIGTTNMRGTFGLEFNYDTDNDFCGPNIETLDTDRIIYDTYICDDDDIYQIIFFHNDDGTSRIDNTGFQDQSGVTVNLRTYDAPTNYYDGVYEIGWHELHLLDLDWSSDDFSTYIYNQTYFEFPRGVSSNMHSGSYGADAGDMIFRSSVTSNSDCAVFIDNFRVIKWDDDWNNLEINQIEEEEYCAEEEPTGTCWGETSTILYIPPSCKYYTNVKEEIG